MRRELDELKGMVHLAVATMNIQNNRFPTEHIVDVFNPQVVEETLSVEEVPQENLVPVPVPGPSLEIPQMLWEVQVLHFEPSCWSLLSLCCLFLC